MWYHNAITSAENEAVADDEEEDTWQTKAELEAIEAEINAESLVLTKAKSSREPPPSLILPLLPYQKEFLSWAIEQETGPVRGGILAGVAKLAFICSALFEHMLAPHTFWSRHCTTTLNLFQQLLACR